MIINETKWDVFKDVVETLHVMGGAPDDYCKELIDHYDAALPDNLPGTGGGEMNMTRKCYVVIGDKENPAKFYGVFQVAKVVGESPLIGGHSAGQIMEPVAVVEYNSQLHKVYLNQVHFEDEVED